MVIQSSKVLRCSPLRFVLIVLLTKVLTLCECIQGCRPKWFGKRCEFECHCNSGDCSNDGDCQMCNKGYFGHKCQYVNEAFLNIVPKTVYSDGDESTCTSNTQMKVFEARFKFEISLTWFRIIANNNANLLNFTMTWNGNITCGINRKFIVDNRTVDGMCDVPINVLTIRIEGPLVGSLCEFMFSGGKNHLVAVSKYGVFLSLSGTTGQTSNACNGCGSDNAVDGIYLPDDPLSRCAITKEETNPPEWFLNLYHPHVLHSVVIIANEDNKTMHMGLAVKTVTSTGIEIILDKIDDWLSEVRFQIQSQWHHTPVVQLSVTQASNNRGSKKQLIICEVVALGDLYCPKNTYGLDCTECNCSDTEVCNRFTGGCGAACPVGFYGVNCTFLCPTNCLDDVCNFYNGTCRGCKPGYKGKGCTNECQQQTYGQDCQYTCSEFCIGKCDHVTGYCSLCGKNRLAPRCIDCPKGFYGTNCSFKCPVTCDRVCEVNSGECFWCISKNFFGRFCEDCADGYYGEKCDFECSRLCVKKKCDRLSGDCLDCLGLRIGAKCEDCAGNFYGLHCDQSCSMFCFNKTCNGVTGKCDACKKGYQGEYCTTVSEKPSFYTAALSIVPFVMLVFFLIPGCGYESDDDEDYPALGRKDFCSPNGNPE